MPAATMPAAHRPLPASSRHAGILSILEDLAMRSLCRTAVLLAAFMLAGCDRDATQLAGPTTPVPAAAHRDVVAQVATPQLAGGQFTVCALRVDGSITCWGSGSGVAGDHGGAFVQIESGENNSCALSPSGGVGCFGLAPST